ncbi:MAG: selenocysteine-specific translation elongation factor [Acidobacteriota bacterium]
MKHVIVGTAGHIDHGKTALVRTLTGTDTDRLKEEKQRGITIDIGFADLTIGDVRFGFVDVPGHERFVKNMLAGAHGIDLVMLVIAADEAVMPQTREHFDICKLLQVKSGLTVLTKADLVDEELLELAKAEVAEFVVGSFLENAPILAVSSKTGQGIEELKQALIQLAAQIAPKNIDSVARLPIDRSFIIKGFGTVVTGTLTSGQLNIGDELDILPGQAHTRVRGLQVHGNSVTEALAGQRTAINLQGVSLDQVVRGQSLVPAGRFQTTFMLDVLLELLPNAPRSLTQRTRVRLHHDTAEVLARVVLLEGMELLPGARQFAQLRLESATFALPGDRFIIRSYSPQITIGGGQIVDALPLKHRLKDREVVPLLAKLAVADETERAALFIEIRGIHGLTQPQLAACSTVTDTHLATLVEELVRSGRILRADSQPPHLLALSAYNQLKNRLLELLKEFHRREPLQPGISREQVRERIFHTLRPEVFKSVVDWLMAERAIVAERDILRLTSHQIALTGEDEKIKQELEAKFKAVGCQAATYDEIARGFSINAARLRKIFQLLLNAQRVVRVGEFIFHRETIDELISRIKALKAQSTKLDIATFKDVTGLSRKYAIPLLEYLDTHGITRRVGNDREIL